MTRVLALYASVLTAGMWGAFYFGMPAAHCQARVPSGATYLPLAPTDTFLYVGRSTYRSRPQKFDTVFTDTVKVYRTSRDSFCLVVRQFVYRQDSSTPGLDALPPVLEAASLKFEINPTAIYRFLFIGQEASANRRIYFHGRDSVNFNDEIEFVPEKWVGKRVFKGKLAH